MKRSRGQIIFLHSLSSNEHQTPSENLSRSPSAGGYKNGESGGNSTLSRILQVKNMSSKTIVPTRMGAAVISSLFSMTAIYTVLVMSPWAMSMTAITIVSLVAVMSSVDDDMADVLFSEGTDADASDFPGGKFDDSDIPKCLATFFKDLSLASYPASDLGEFEGAEYRLDRAGTAEGLICETNEHREATGMRARLTENEDTGSSSASASTSAKDIEALKNKDQGGANSGAVSSQPNSEQVELAPNPPSPNSIVAGLSTGNNRNGGGAAQGPKVAEREQEQQEQEQQQPVTANPEDARETVAASEPITATAETPSAQQDWPIAIVAAGTITVLVLGFMAKRKN